MRLKMYFGKRRTFISASICKMLCDDLCADMYRRNVQEEDPEIEFPCTVEMQHTTNELSIIAVCLAAW